jgi:hypothetical protein
MFSRGSDLQSKSCYYLKDLISNLVNFSDKCWVIDVDQYSSENIKILDQTYTEIQKIFNYTATQTLITKIMLGIFGNVPAIDINVRTSLSLYGLFERNLIKVKEFYDLNKNVIDGYRTNTIDFYTAQNTTRYYKKAKIVDMIAFIEGDIINKQKHKPGRHPL